MNNSLRHSLLAFATVLACTATLWGQVTGPHVGYVYPAGAKQGTTLQIKIGGQALDGVKEAYVSGAGITAKVIDFTRPVTQAEANALLDRLRAMLEKKGINTDGLGKNGKGQSLLGVMAKLTPEERKQVQEIRMKIASAVRKVATPAIAQTVTVELTVPADVSPGTRELRLATPQGLTNPIAFRIGTLPEVSKPAAKPQPDVRKQQKNQKLGMLARSAPERPETKITLPAVINGQVEPGGVDRYRFTAKKGQELLVAADARELIPYISDAVPGWFQAAIAVFDADGKELTYADHYLYHPDPRVRFVIPKDGDYLIEIHDSIYRGREDFVYRITAGEVSQVAAALPSDSAAPPPSDGKLPECEVESTNHDVATAQAVKLPIVVKGSIAAPGNRNVFRIDGHAGQEIVAEVTARRLGSPLDSVLRLTDAAGKQIAFNDDHDDQASGLITHHADSYLMAKLPADGVYYLHLSDAQRKGGAGFTYRLRISPPQPDFELRVVPASLNARAGMNVPVYVYVQRRDGFKGDIRLNLQNAPAGFSLMGGMLPGTEDKVRVTLAVPSSGADRPVPLHLEGTARCGDREIKHPAVPAQDMMQAFFYRHLVPSADWLVAVSGRAGRGRGGIRLAGDSSVKLTAGGTAELKVNLPSGPLADSLQYELSDPPEGISIAKVTHGDAGTQIVLKADASVKKGTRGNLIIDAVIERPAVGKAPKNARRPRATVGSLPAVPFEIAAN